MKKVLKWIGIVLGALVVLIVLAVGVGYARGSAMIDKEYTFELETFPIPDDAESIANGEYLAHSLLACIGCHGEDLGGQEFINDEGFLVVYTPNLTSGEGGIGSSYTDDDWIRSLRHGVRPNGENLIVMPAQYLARLGQEDIADIVAYLKTLPPVDNVQPERQIAFMPRVMMGLGVIPASDVAEILPASGIDHDAPIPGMPEKGVTAEWGSYRALVCRACHGENLSGIPENPQNGSPASANLTPGGELLVWDEADFLNFMRTGVTPTGREVDPMIMPWNEFGNATDEDLRAIFMYLKSLEPLETYTPAGK